MDAWLLGAELSTAAGLGIVLEQQQINSGPEPCCSNWSFTSVAAFGRQWAELKKAGKQISSATAARA